MVRRLPWAHPHLKVGHTAEGRATTTTTAAVVPTVIATRNTGRSSSTTTIPKTLAKMVSRTPRGGRRLMYNSSPSRSGGRSSSRTYAPSSARRTDAGSPSPPPSQRRRLDGLYFEGNWYCNCTPRQLASHFQVKKKNANNGRFFYKCEKRRGGCNFFLWEEDAQNRAQGATLTLPPMPTEGGTSGAGAGAGTARATTPTTQVPTPSTASALRFGVAPTATAPPTVAEAPPSPSAWRSAARQRFLNTYFSTRSTQVPNEANGPPDESGTGTSSRTAAKRKRVLFEFDSGDGEDEYGLGDVSSDEERAMNDAMERSAKKLRDAAPMPSTPAAQRTTRDAALPTPQTVTRTLFPDAKRRRADDGPVSAAENPARVSLSTGTPFAAVGGPPSSPPTSTPSMEVEDQLDPTEEVMALLGGQRADEATRRGVRDVLRRFSMKAKGLARGRETVRAALKAKDERLAELQERVASLEARNRAQREEIADFKAGMMELCSKH